MYDWIEQVTWDDALKLAQHMHSIPKASIKFDAVDDHIRSFPIEASNGFIRTLQFFLPTRERARMTKFSRLFGYINGNRRLYCKATMSDVHSKQKHDLY